MSSVNQRFPVLLLHGWPVTDKHWRHLIPQLERAGFTPMPATLPGLGTEADEQQSFRKADLAAWVRAWASERGLTKFALVGHDWGATVAILLAHELTDAVTALVVEEEVLPGIDVEIPLPGRDFYPTWHGLFNRAVGLAEDLVPGREAAFYGRFLRQSAGPAGLQEEALEAYIQAYSSANVLRSGLGYYRTREADLRAVQELTSSPITEVPVLALGGRYAMGSAVAEGLRPLAQNLTGHIFEESGHYPVEQEPDAVSRVILEFLTRHHPRD